VLLLQAQTLRERLELVTADRDALEARAEEVGRAAAWLGGALVVVEARGRGGNRPGLRGRSTAVRCLIVQAIKAAVASTVQAAPKSEPKPPAASASSEGRRAGVARTISIDVVRPAAQVGAPPSHYCMACA